MKKEIEKGAEKLTDIAQAHLSKLPPRERAERLRAFRKIVAKVGAKTSKPAGHSESRPIPLSARGRE